MRKALALLAMIVSIFTLAACGDTHGASGSKNPTSLVGEWHQVNSNPNGWLTASISGEAIQVNLRGRDTSSIFWLGSFDTDRTPVGKFKVVSLGDQDAMRWKITASTESKKTFTYNNGDLSFEFSAMGSSTTIHMAKTQTADISSPTPMRTTKSTPKTSATKAVSPPKFSLKKKK
jgi:hypothetical protein